MSTVGAVVLMVGVSWIALADFGARTAGLTFVAMPNRAVVVLAQAALAAVFSAVLGWVLLPLAYVVGEGIATGAAGWPSRLLSLDGARPLGLYPVVLACEAAIAVGVAAATRNVPVAIGLNVIGAVLADSVLRAVPGGGLLAVLLPAGNGAALAGLDDPGNYPWGPTGNAVLLVGGVVVSLAVACWAANRRDVAG